MSGSIQQFGEVVHGAHQPATTLACHNVMFAAGAQFGGADIDATDRPPAVGEQPLGIAHRGFSQLGEHTSAR